MLAIRATPHWISFVPVGSILLGPGCLVRYQSLQYTDRSAYTDRLFP